MYVHTCTDDSDCDQDFDVNNEEQFIVWAVGALEETALIHFERADRKLMPHYCVVLVWLNHVQGDWGVGELVGGQVETVFIHFERANRKLMPHYCVVLVWLNHVQGRGGALGLANLQLCVCVHLPPLPRYFSKCACMCVCMCVCMHACACMCWYWIISPSHLVSIAMQHIAA